MSSNLIDTRSRRLRLYGDSTGLRTPVEKTPEPSAEEAPVAPRRPRHPPWIKAKLPSGETYFEVRELVHKLQLHTVCESASCPNIGECWSRRALTIMILGGICTRSCQFCDVPMATAKNPPLPPDPDEPRRVAEVLAELGLDHTVITCVDRDDLSDGGAAHWAATLRAVRERCPTMTVEVLVGDFRGDLAAVDVVLAAKPDVFAHNLETVPRLSRQVRIQASYPRSYSVLRHARDASAIVKTGLMLGLGETRDEVAEVLAELAALRVDIVTIGQYLRPSPAHLAIARYVEPAEFEELKVHALSLGIRHVESGPLVRSSYHADGQAALIRALRPA